MIIGNIQIALTIYRNTIRIVKRCPVSSAVCHTPCTITGKSRHLALRRYFTDLAVAYIGNVQIACFIYCNPIGVRKHGGIAFGFDRLCAILGGSESIRDFIAFPKNNSGRDVMLDAPSTIDDKQLEELAIQLNTAGRDSL